MKDGDVRKDQTKFWGSILITALHDSNGNVVGFSKVTRDLTADENSERQFKGIYRKDRKK